MPLLDREHEWRREAWLVGLGAAGEKAAYDEQVPLRTRQHKRRGVGFKWELRDMCGGSAGVDIEGGESPKPNAAFVRALDAARAALDEFRGLNAGEMSDGLLALSASCARSTRVRLTKGAREMATATMAVLTAATSPPPPAIKLHSAARPRSTTCARCRCRPRALARYLKGGEGRGANGEEEEESRRRRGGEEGRRRG